MFLAINFRFYIGYDNPLAWIQILLHSLVLFGFVIFFAEFSKSSFLGPMVIFLLDTS